MNLTNPVKETIKIYAKHLKTPTFSHYDEIVRQLAPEEGYEHFLCKLLKQEIDGRQDNLQKRKIKAAKFPFSKTFDEFDLLLTSQTLSHSIDNRSIFSIRKFCSTLENAGFYHDFACAIVVFLL